MEVNINNQSKIIIL